MDSGNSGSLQSSSGDEEFDSRADAISAFMINHPPGGGGGAAHVGPISNPPPPETTTNSSSIFDHRQPLWPPPSTALLNLDMPWSKTLRSDPNSINPLHSLFGGSQPQLQTHHGGGVVSSSSAFAATQAVSIPSVAPEITSATNTPRSAASDHHQIQTHVGRNPKKRSRASRRAPTTVLTTDTTNFRAMVQEFTGIPAPPFTSSPFSRNRGLDLYAPPPSAAMRSNNPLDASQQPQYLRRPFPQKVQLPPPPAFLAASSVIDHAIASSNSTNNDLNTNISTGLNINVPPNGTSSDHHHLNYQMPSELGRLKPPLINPILTALLQSNSAKFLPPPPPSNSSILGSKTENIPSNDSHLKMGSVLDEFNLSHGQVNGLPGLISSDHRHQTGLISSNDSNDQNQTQSQVMSAAGINGNFNFSRNIMNAANGGHSKLNYSASSSSFHGDKGSDNVNASSRGEGMMESWICSSE